MDLIKSFFCWVGAHDLKLLDVYVDINPHNYPARPHQVKKCTHCGVTYENTRYDTWRKCTMHQKYKWRG